MKLLERWKSRKALREAEKDPLMVWMMRIIAAEEDYCASCGAVDPTPMREFLHKRMQQHAINHLTKKR